ncbi:MAG: hypothetical protein U9N76_01575 [Candidatus Marinimicrobia bacterium]|nr:hypothetical protein [Candidatus Neomarinimicrobiota bacterium]
MKKLLLFITLITIISCGSIQNELEITLKKTDTSTKIDSLINSIIKMDGVNSVIISVDSFNITIIYNRLNNSEENIIKKIKKNNYEIELIKKKRLK